LKRISKSLPPNVLTAFAASNPVATWEHDFRNHKGSQDYKSLRQLMLSDQGGLCGYCESKVVGLPAHKQRVEHFHDKSDRANVAIHNWGLDWQNIFAVCIGGNDADQSAHPLPENLSCDSHKNHLKDELDTVPEGHLLNPLTMPHTPCLFTLDKRTGELKPDATACTQVNIADNHFATVQELVDNTIRVLNLNCPRLTDQRQLVLRAYNRALRIAQDKNIQRPHARLAEQWFSLTWPEFFTTRRLLLGGHAEQYLTTSNYNG